MVGARGQGHLPQSGVSWTGQGSYTHEISTVWLPKPDLPPDNTSVDRGKCQKLNIGSDDVDGWREVQRES